MTDFTGTPHFLAPELLLQKYDKKVDIWACGIIMYLLLCGYPPFSGPTLSETFHSIANDHLIFPEPDWTEISSEAKDLLKKLLCKNPKDRIEGENVIKHSWFARVSSPKVNPAVLKSVVDKMKKFKNSIKLENVVWSFIINFFLTKEEAHEIFELFRILDLDKDGMISRKELECCNKKLLGKYLKDKEIDEIMKQMDIDKTGFITISEFTTAVISRERVLSNERLTRTFRIIDTDHNGSISLQELKEFFFIERSNLSQDELQRFIAEADLDHDGEISLAEFVGIMKKLVF